MLYKKWEEKKTFPIKSVLKAVQVSNKNSETTSRNKTGCNQEQLYANTYLSYLHPSSPLVSQVYKSYRQFVWSFSTVILKTLPPVLYKI